MNTMADYGGWALITGASSGIGAEFARALAARGANCVLVARRQDRLEALAVELAAAHGVQCRCVPQDLSAAEGPDAVVEAAADAPVGMLVNNAGVGCSGHFESCDAARLAAMIALNCTAPVLLARAFLPGMLERGRGAIINVASISSFVPVPYDAVYGATKAFDLHFGEALWAELIDTPIDVLNVCPYLTATEFYQAEGMGAEAIQAARRQSDAPEDVVRLALNALGRRPTASPWATALAAFASRFGPRALTARVMRREMRKIHFDQLER